jgi:hypothetical protein
VRLERGPLSLVRIIEELLQWKSSGSGQENRINGSGDPLRWPRDTLYPQNSALTSPTSGGRSVSIVRLRTKITDFFNMKHKSVQFTYWITWRRNTFLSRRSKFLSDNKLTYLVYAWRYFRIFFFVFLVSCAYSSPKV